MPAIIDLLESAEHPITEIPSVVEEVEKYLKSAWDAGISDAVEAGQIPESIVGTTVEDMGIAADLFTTAAEGASLALSLVSLVGLLVFLVLTLVAVAIVTLHRQIHHIAANIPLTNGILAGWEDDAYNLIRPVLHGIEQQLIHYLTDFLIDVRKLVQWLYGIDPYRLVRFLEHFIQAHLHGLSIDVNTILHQVQHIVSTLTPTISHLWSNVHGLWTRLTYLENLISTAQQAATNAWEAAQLALQSIHDLWSFAEDIMSKVANLDILVTSAETEIQTLTHRIGTLEGELSSALNHIAWLESIVVPTAAIATVVAPLMPLADAGAGGIDKLTRVADGECPCPPEPPDLDASQCGWLEKILHAAGSSLHA